MKYSNKKTIEKLKEIMKHHDSNLNTTNSKTLNKIRDLIK